MATTVDVSPDGARDGRVARMSDHPADGQPGGPPPSAGRAIGFAAAAFAFVVWGFFPIYFKRLDELSSLEILAWRIVCSFAVIAPALLIRPGPRALVRRLATLRRRWPIVAATALISVNWLVFILAVTDGRVIEAGLGYFLVPLVNSGLGILFFGERPNRWRIGALAVAAAGMALAFLVAGTLPFVSLTLAATFGLYGAVRKASELDSATGLLLETALLVPLAGIYLLVAGTSPATLDGATLGWLLASGVLTLAPLFAVVVAARRLEMGTVGVFQYITPTMQLGFAVWLYGEHFDAARTVALASTLVAVMLWLAGARAPRRA